MILLIAAAALQDFYSISWRFSNWVQQKSSCKAGACEAL